MAWCLKCWCALLYNNLWTPVISVQLFDTKHLWFVKRDDWDNWGLWVTIWTQQLRLRCRIHILYTSHLLKLTINISVALINTRWVTWNGIVEWGPCKEKNAFRQWWGHQVRGYYGNNEEIYWFHSLRGMSPLQEGILAPKSQYECLHKDKSTMWSHD